MTFQHFSNFEGKYSVGSIWSLIKKVGLQTTFFTQKYYLVLTTSLKARLKVSIICSNSMERLEGRSKMLEKF